MQRSPLHGPHTTLEEQDDQNQEHRILKDVRQVQPTIDEE